MSGLETWPYTTHAFELPLRYSLRGPTDSGLVICLHGYQDHALSMLRRLGWDGRDDLGFGVLAINAPFPVPIWGARGFTEAYAWYFRDTTRGIAVGSPERAAEAIVELTTHLGLAQAPTVVFGFSQGGFLAPAVARRLAHPRGLLAFAAGFPPELYRDLPRLPVFGLHGDADERVPVGPAREAHARLLELGFPGEFVTVPGLDHRIQPEIEPRIHAILNSLLG